MVKRHRLQRFPIFCRIESSPIRSKNSRYWEWYATTHRKTIATWTARCQLEEAFDNWRRFHLEYGQWNSLIKNYKTQQNHILLKYFPHFKCIRTKNLKNCVFGYFSLFCRSILIKKKSHNSFVTQKKKKSSY